METKVIKLPIFDIEGHIKYLSPEEVNVKEIRLHKKDLTIRRNYMCECNKDEHDPGLGMETRNIDSTESIPKDKITQIGFSNALDKESVWILSIETGGTEYTYNFKNHNEAESAYLELIAWLYS